MENTSQHYIVHEDALPDGLKRVCLAQKLLMGGHAKTVTKAIELAGVSRSAFYKYRGLIRPFTKADRDNIITLQAVLEHRAGVLGNFLNTVARAGANVITVNQSMPAGGVAGITLSVNTAQMNLSTDGLIRRLAAASGVENVALLIGE